ncbi:MULTISPECIES: LysR family transcriptional regulator [Chromobacterium]|uniref:LysR family transcriptional regulator n=1 Tax=Chromobacterium rhizoryzae TaxID=1778675 RepID=A0AAD0W8N5_9NEIS|nr:MULTISPECIES: LysR family transcriptional regulator [Chromobacterium]AXT47530.1 LysR family transcriptional regulator [Chromobacterium rhizoryzae]PTU71308.1 LysR family transcriptional regulator [Chromobacterium haemolyticum]QOD81365.1 LysR family transcriptional regulator [Chromobacterium haemolyticum]
MDTKRLDLNLLVTLEALLVEQNVTRAAARLSLSQPAVSAQLNRLRELFDDPLLVTVHRGMYPTAKALEMFEPLRKALNEVRATVAGHQDFEPASADLTVAIACTDYLQAALLIPLARELHKSAPGVRVAVRTLDPHRLEAQLEQGDLDLALLTPPAAPSKLNSCRLFDEHYVLIGRRDHPALKEGLSVEEYAALDHVIVSLDGNGFFTPVDRTLAALGLRRNVALSAASFLFVPEMVAQSDFVALVPQRLVQDRCDALKQVEFPLPTESFEVGMAWHDRTQQHPGHRWMRDFIVTLVNAQAGSAADAVPLS